MPTLKIWKTANPTAFNYVVDSETVALEVYAGSTLLLSALNKYISYNASEPTKWEFVREAGDQNTATSFLGRDGVLYTNPHPTFIYEKIDTGNTDFMGGPIYQYVRIDLINESNVSDDDIWVIDPMGGYKTMFLWKTQNLYTAVPTGNDGGITALKESITGFMLPVSKINSVLGSTGEAIATALPREVVLMFYTVAMHFHARLDRTAFINSNNEFEF